MNDAQCRCPVDTLMLAAILNRFWFGMTIQIPSQRHFNLAYWLSAGTIEQRLELLLPPDVMRAASIETVKMPGNSTFVKYVYRHTITEKSTGQKLEIIEKSVRKLVFLPSTESAFYRERSVLARSNKFRHPRCYGVIETPFESIIFTRFINGRPPRMAEACEKIALGISELECTTSTYLKDNHHQRPIQHWRMEFFQPWYLFRPKYSHSKLFKNVDILRQKDLNWTPSSSDFNRTLSPLIAKLRSNAKSSTRCFSHLDYLRKNLIESKHSLFLIDWSEVRIGRIGFDSGAYLSNLFRNSEITDFEPLASEYLATYYRELPKEHQNQETANNILYIFLLHSIWYCMRKDVIKSFLTDATPKNLDKKLNYLLRANTALFQPPY